MFQPLTNKAELVRRIRGESSDEDETRSRYSPLNPNVLIVPALGPRKIPFEPGPDTDRDKILRNAYRYLAERNVSYVPIDIMDDIEASYEDDDLDAFRDTVRGWIRALAKGAA